MKFYQLWLPILAAVLLSTGVVGAESNSPAANSSVAKPVANVSREYLARSDRLHYHKTSGLTPLQRPVSLCEIAQRFRGPAGVYRVENLIGVTEPVPAAPHLKDGYTYVELARVEPWGADAPAKVTVRMSGGPTETAGVTKTWQVAFELGEEVGLVLLPPSPENRNYYGVHNLGVFRKNSARRDADATNGQLFRKSKLNLTAIGKLVSAMRVASSCAPLDVFPDRDDASLPGVHVAGDAQVVSPRTGPHTAKRSPPKAVPADKPRDAQPLRGGSSSR
jgi:hypothetical protein